MHSVAFLWKCPVQPLSIDSLHFKDSRKDSKTLKPKAASSYSANAKQDMYATCKLMSLVTQCGCPVEMSCSATFFACQGPQERQTDFEEDGLGDGK